MIKSKIVVALMLVMLVPIAGYAQNCDGALKLDTKDVGSDTRSQLSYLNTITKEKFAELQTSKEIDTDFLGFGMDINGDTDFDTFKTERAKVFKEYSYSHNFNQAKSYVTQTMSDNAKQAYIACLTVWSTTQPGVHVIPEKIAESEIQVKVVTNPPVDGLKPKLELESVRPSDINDSDAIQNTLDKLEARGSIGLTVSRKSDEDASIVINSVKRFFGGGYNATGRFFVASVPEIVEPQCKDNQDLVNGRCENREPKIAQPVGVIGLVYYWWPGVGVENLPNGHCNYSNGYRQYGWDGNADLAYCQKRGQANRYVSDVKIIHGTHAGVSCQARFGQGWIKYAWDGKSTTMLCMKLVTFNELKLGQTYYIEKMVAAWPDACPAPYAELARKNTNNLRFCGILKRLTP